MIKLLTILMFPLYVWSLPNTMIGLILAVYHDPTNIEWRDGAIVMTGLRRPLLGTSSDYNVGAQTWGCVILFEDLVPDEAELHHEMTHVDQGLWGGVIYLGAYGGHYAWNRWYHGMEPYNAYLAIYFERRARHLTWRFGP